MRRKRDTDEEESLDSWQSRGFGDGGRAIRSTRSNAQGEERRDVMSARRRDGNTGCEVDKMRRRQVQKRKMDQAAAPQMLHAVGWSTESVSDLYQKTVATGDSRSVCRSSGLVETEGVRGLPGRSRPDRGR